MKRALLKKALFIVFLFAVTGLVGGQEQPPSPPNGGPGYQGSPNGGQGGGEQQGPGVGHISMIRGDVSLQRGDSGDWVATSQNTPVVGGDVVATAAGSRAEVQLDFADVIRLASQTQAKVADLSRNHIQIQVSQGNLNLSMFQGGNAEVEVDSPNVSVRPTKNGRYLVQVNSDSETLVIVRNGEAEVSTPQGSTTVGEGEMISIRGTDDPEYKTDPAPGADDWDTWNLQRDNVIRNSDGARHTNSYYTGTQDLDTYGHWVYVPNYGQVWSPNDQPANWAPYQAGRWSWEPYYGWTWVSYEPWGWAPYHYGRWFVYGSSWYWWPGPVTPYYYPTWGPAFVGFLGFGPHIGFGFGFGTIGWFPLGPFEVFHPWFGFGFNRFGVFGGPFGFHGNLGLAFNNPRIRAGITTVAAGNFGRGGVFGHGVDVGTLRGARLANGNIGITPTRESLASTSRGFRSAPGGFRDAGSTHFFSRTSVSHSTSSFHEDTARMQEAIRSHGGEGQFGERSQNGSEGRFGQNAGGSGRLGNETRTDRPGSSGGTFGGNERGVSSGAGRDGYHDFSGNGSRGGTFDSRGGQSGFGQNGSGARADRPPSRGGSRQLDLSKQIVVPRSSSSSYGGRSGNYGGTNNGGGRSGSYGAPSYNGGGRGGSYSAPSSNGGGRSGGYSAPKYSGGGRSGGSSSGSHSGGGHSSGGGHGGGGSHGGGHR